MYPVAGGNKALDHSVSSKNRSSDVPRRRIPLLIVEGFEG